MNVLRGILYTLALEIGREICVSHYLISPRFSLAMLAFVSGLVLYFIPKKIDGPFKYSLAGVSCFSVLIFFLYPWLGRRP